MIKLGNNDITLKVGSTDVSAAYLGSTLVYSGGTPPTPPTPSYKWLATYTGGTTSSAECDSSSAITSGEIEITDLVSVEIGQCVTSIGNQAFQRCESLTSVTISNSVTSIGNRAFYNCLGLTEVTIGSGVTSIGEYAFRNCMDLTSITIDALTPPTLGSRAFEGSNCPIYVPGASLSTYKSASGWSTYESRIQSVQPPQWVDYASGEIIPTDLDIYGVSGTSASLCNTFPYVDNTIYFYMERNVVIADIGSGCYSGSYPMSGDIEITFSDVGCHDSYRLDNAVNVITGVKLLIYQ